MVRLGRNAGCHLFLGITFRLFRMIAPLAKSVTDLDFHGLRTAASVLDLMPCRWCCLTTFERLNQTLVNLTRLQPAIPRENILLIEAIHDWLAPKEDVSDFSSAAAANRFETTTARP